MLIAYFDEVKFAPPVQPYNWLAGLVVDSRLVRQLEDQVSTLAEECFGDARLGRDTEFHAASIFNRKDNFKNWGDIGRRVAVLKHLMAIIDRPGEVFKVHARLDPARMVKVDQLDEMTFTFFVERVDMLAGDVHSECLLIGDYEHDRGRSIAAESLSSFRRSRTPYYYGRELQHLVDTVHFTPSHLSRMLQLADVFVWSLQLTATPSTGSPIREELAAHVRTKTSLLVPNRYKEWPTEDAWIHK
jgi:hypothetical protein